MNYDTWWEEQIKDMDNEDNYYEYITNNKIYPWGVFNATANPIFKTLSWARRVATIRHIILTNGNVKKNSILFDQINNVVYFETTKGIYHKCDLERKHIKAWSIKQYCLISSPFN